MFFFSAPTHLKTELYNTGGRLNHPTFEVLAFIVGFNEEDMLY